MLKLITNLLGSLYDPNQPTSYILYVDANNLYGWAMSQVMPDDQIEWLTDAECRAAEQALNNKQTRDQFFDNQANPMAGYARLANELERVAGTPRGDELAAQLEYMIHHIDPRHYIFEVDLEYPPEIHNRDDDYPMAPEVMTISAEQTGQKQLELRAKYFAAACPHSRKLICSFLPKKRYVVLGHLLRFYLDRGMRLTKVHRGIKFTANPYLQPYINNNTEKRNMYKKDDVKKNFYKLMNNSPYGKTIENAARRSDIRLLNDPEKARRLAEKPHCVDFRIFD